ncbi:MAG: hypothetical protein AAF762_10915 [Pseudomonadota bacterium]
MATIGKTPSEQTFGDDIADSRRFWLVLRRNTPQNEIVGTVAARLDQIDTDPRAFLESELAYYWCEDGTVDLHLPDRVQRALQGWSVYLGDLYFRADETGDRQKTFAFVHAAYALALARWPKAQALYVYMRMADYLEKNAVYGFTTAAALNAVEWSEPQTYRSQYECLALLSREDFVANANALLRSPELFEELPDRRPRSAWAKPASPPQPNPAHPAIYSA